MRRPSPSSSQAMLLLLILAVGPLQAQAIFACAMMETVVHDACCCDNHKAYDDCLESKYDPSKESGGDPCCERSVEVGVDQDAGQNAPLVKPTEVRSDADPPQDFASSFPSLVSPEPLLVPDAFLVSPATGHSGSDTYLITQRLRI